MQKYPSEYNRFLVSTLNAKRLSILKMLVNY